MNLRLDWCSYEAAKHAVMNWHYSRCMPKGRNNYIGVWEDNQFIGVIVYGYSISPSLGYSFGLKQTEVTELRRVALRDHKNQVSRMIAYSIKLLRKKNPGIKLIVSFADSEQGHIGGIYQAGNWTYIGSTSIRQKKINGKWRGDVHAQKMKVTETRKAPEKYKYLYPLDKEMRKQIEPLTKPYPKKNCDSGVNRSTPSFQDGGGGAEPTESLYNYA